MHLQGLDVTVLKLADAPSLPDNDPMPAQTPPPTPTVVDLDQDFPTLPRDPIVEAMIIFAGRAKTEWNPETTGPRIKAAFPDYPGGQHVNFARISFAIDTQPALPDAPGTKSTATAENLGWLGLRLVSSDGKQVITPARDGLTLSRLAPYQGWPQLSAEMLRLWRIHKEIAQVDSIDQLQVRYINRLEVPLEDFDPAQYFAGFGTSPQSMSRGPFLHQDSLGHLGLPRCLLNLVRTVELPSPQSSTIPLIVVLEAIHAEPIPAEDGIIERRLAELHWLKNHAFFSSLTEKFLDLCR